MTRATWLVAAALTTLALPARADLQVRSPLVEYGEAEIEHNGLVAFNKKGSATNGAQSYTYSLGYGVTPFWKLELEAETGALPPQNQAYLATTLENTVQLVPDGQYAANLGLFAEYSHAAPRGLPDTITLGPIVQTELHDVLGTDSRHTLNLFIARDVGQHHANDTALAYAGQSLLLLHPLFNPGLELYGGIGNVTNAGRYADQQQSLGPVVTGAYRLPGYGKLRYEVGYQFGLTSPAPRGAVRWKFEYEITF